MKQGVAFCREKHLQNLETTPLPKYYRPAGSIFLWSQLPGGETGDSEVCDQP